MILEVDEALEEWVHSVHKGMSVSFLASGPDDPKKAGVNLYLFQMQPMPFPRPAREEPPLRVALSYLVTAWTPDPMEMHRILGELLFAALDNPAWEVANDPPSVTLWQSLGIPVRPAFSLKAYATKERPAKRAQLVRDQLVIRDASLRPLLGMVRGPERNKVAMPIMGATVEIPSLHLSTTTDYQGRFKFTAIPADPAIHKLVVNVKGKTMELNSPALPAPEEAFVVDLPKDFFEQNTPDS